MHESADAVGTLGGEVYLVGAGVVVELHSVEGMVLAGVVEVPGVGPHGVVGAAVGFAVAGVIDIYVVDISVAVGVILAEVDLVVESLTGVDHHVLGM